MELVLRGMRQAFQHGDAFLRLVGLLVLCFSLSTFAAAAQTSEISANSLVSQHWRGAYDILVRSPMAMLDVEKKTGLVEGDYLSLPQGGITLNQYELIKSLPDVEVAAPVATIGYMHNLLGTVNLDLSPQTGSLYRIEVTLNHGGRTLDQHVAYIARLQAADPQADPGMPFDSIFNYALAPILMDPQGAVSSYVSDLPPLWTLVAGIEPEQESKLVGLDKAVQGSALPTQLGKEVDPGSHEEKTIIPLWVSQRSFLEMSAELRISAAPLSDVKALQALGLVSSPKADPNGLKKLQDFFDSLQGKVLSDQTVSFDRAIQPMRLLSFTFAPDQPLKISNEGIFFSTGTRIMLYPGSIAYQVSSPPPSGSKLYAFQVNSLGEWGKVIEPAYKALMEQGVRETSVQIPADTPLFHSLTPYLTPPVNFKIYGTYDFERLGSVQDPLTYVPLGIYEPPLAVLRYDEEGKPVAPQVLTPDLNPAGFIPRPPLALTTLEGAHFLLGREDFISAIRVRVAGIDAYTTKNVAEVERVAGEITERTGLHVDIVAGSSPQKVLVKVPGLGYVEERWTTLGAAQTVINGINAANLTLLGWILICAALFITNASQVSLLGRREEIGLLKALGWQTVQVRWNLLGESAGLGLLSALLASLTSLVLSFTLGLSPNLWVIAGVSLAAPLLYVGVSWPAVDRAARELPAQALRLGEMNATRRGGSLSALSFPGLARRELMRRRTRTWLNLLGLGVGVAQALLVLGILLHLQGRLQITLLGESVVLHLRSYHTLMTASILAMGCLAVLENLLLGVIVRRRSFALLRAMGWRRSHLFWMVLWEGLILGALGGLMGLALGAPLLAVLLGGLSVSQLWLFPALFFGAVSLGALSAIYPAFLARGVKPAQELAEGGAPRRADLRLRAWRLGQTLLLVLLMLITAGLVGGRTQVIEQVLGVRGGPKLTLVPAEAAVSSQEVMKRVTMLAAQGERNLGNANERQAAKQLVGAFSAQGLDVKELPLVLSNLQIEDAGGNVLLEAPSHQLSLGGLAFHGKELDLGKALTGPLLFLPSGTAMPQATELLDKIVVVEEAKGAVQGEAIRQFVMHYAGQVPCLAVTSVVLSEEREESINLLSQDGLQARLAVGENVMAVLPGILHPEQEVWLVAHYDSRLGSPGADLGASGPAGLVEIARLFSRQGFPYTLRFIALDGTDTGLEGAVNFLQREVSTTKQVRAVLELDELGAWEQMTLSADLSGEGASSVDMARLKQEGQFFLKEIWMRRMDLDRPDLLKWMNNESKRSQGLSETPLDLRQTAQVAASELGLTLQPYVFSPCTLTGHTFLARGYPTLIFCGQGNGLAGTSYDTPQNLNPQKLRKAIALTYKIVEYLGETP